MKQLLIATQNKHKIIELTTLLSPLGYTIKTLYDYPEIPEIEETGTTFEANALIKAETLANLTGSTVIADDSGLVVEALGGAPGVYSARYAGEGSSYDDNNQKLLQEMAGKRNRNAYFITVICLYEPNQSPLFFEGRLMGTIATEFKGDHGFGYDPLFVLPDGRHLAQLPTNEKNVISHRANALRSLLQHLQDK